MPETKIDDRFDYTEDGVPIYGPEFWSQDHASLLLYVEVKHLDKGGEMSPDDLRTNADRHSHEQAARSHLAPKDWRDEYATRISDGTRPGKLHDDWDCLDDLEDAKLLIHTGPPNFMVALSEIGVEVAGELRKFKGRGNPISEFDWERAIAEARRKVG